MNLSARTLTISAAAVAAVAVAAAGTVALVASEEAEAEEPSARALSDATSMGVVELVVADRDAMEAFYSVAVGLDTVADDATGTTLGLGGVELIRLVDGDLEPRSAGSAGLYHSAILFADEASLADTLLQVATVAPDTFSGAADHRVSQAFYFVDPEGNGLELYVDRPSDSWEWQDGEVVMGSYALDPNAFILEHATGSLEGREAVMGHVHLSVGDLAEAEEFYSSMLGLDVTSRAEGAIFLSAGGYHHHLAANTWASEGASARGDEYGLSRFEITVGDPADLEGIVERLEASGREYETSGDGIVVDDPWGNTVVVTAA